MNTDALLAGAVPPFLPEAVAFIAVSSIIAYICFRLGLVPIVGFLVAGVLIGPNGLGFVNNQELVDATAEIGVILLLFTIGIEFSLEKFEKIKNLIFIGGGLQVVMSTIAVASLLLVFGIDWKAGIFTGFLISLSSTAIILKLLTDRGETNSLPGQISLGLLIFQDLAVIVMVLLVPILGGQGGSSADIGIALGKAVLIIAVVLIFARKLMPKVLEAVARTCSQELFLLTVIAICFGTAYLTSLAGVSVSLGAFLAGLLVSESRFSQHAFSEILPLQILFSAPISGQSIAALRFEDEYGIRIQEIRRDGMSINALQSNLLVQPGDELVLSGSPGAFVKAAPLFRTDASDETEHATLASSSRLDRDDIDLEQVIELKMNSNSANCSHLGRIHSVTPSARGCEDCLRTGDDWVHLRICMTCGHVGCCDDSKNKHATRHHNETDHPIIRSLEPGEDWAWCYPDEIML